MRSMRVTVAFRLGLSAISQAMLAHGQR